MKIPLPSHPIPKVLGVDDWAYRKRHTYGTILVDLETRQPIDLLPDRTATTLAEWLQKRPVVEIISRDRAKAYKEGASRGCPEAIQVADRFHLLQNLAQMLEVVLNQHRTLLKNVQDETNNCPIVESEKIVPKKTASHTAQPIKPPPNPENALKLAEVRREQRKEKYDQVWALHKKGYGGKAIAHHLGIGKSTVFRYLRSPTFPERKGRSDKGRSKVSPHKKYLLSQWNSGCHDTKKLYAEIKAQGYEGSYVTLARYTHRLREAQGLKLREKPDLLTKWLEKAESSAIRAITGFATKLKDDLDAVRNGVTYQWSNGQVEGQVNRLKMLKRQMYGRASHKLLKKRFLCPI